MATGTLPIRRIRTREAYTTTGAGFHPHLRRRGMGMLRLSVPRVKDSIRMNCRRRWGGRRGGGTRLRRVRSGLLGIIMAHYMVESEILKGTMLVLW